MCASYIQQTLQQLGTNYYYHIQCLENKRWDFLFCLSYNTNHCMAFITPVIQLRTDASCNTQCSRALNAQLPRTCWMRYPLQPSNGWAEFRPELIKSLDMLNHAHWQRMKNNRLTCNVILFLTSRPILISIRLRSFSSCWLVLICFTTFPLKACNSIRIKQLLLYYGLFILRRNYVALPHCSLLHRTCEDTELWYHMKATFISPWNAVKLRQLAQKVIYKPWSRIGHFWLYIQKFDIPMICAMNFSSHCM